MASLLVVADEPWVTNDVRASLADPALTIIELDDPRNVVAQVREHAIDLVIVDMQVGSMGGMAVTRTVRHIGPAAPPVIVLLDRDADAFLARRAGAAAWVRKPFSAPSLRAAVNSQLAAGSTTAAGS